MSIHLNDSLNSSYFVIPVTEEEFLDLAQKLRHFTQRQMMIEVAPWIRDYVVEMQELYCELILEKIAYTPFGMEIIKLSNYEVLFKEHDEVPSKILAKGDPGMGKTTLAKKIAWDWAMNYYQKFSLVLFVFLKYVHPNDSLEEAMLKQMSGLRGLGITPRKLESIMENFGRQCLLICDGLDENVMGSNHDVMKVLRHEKYLNSNVFVTSRPHSVSETGKYFHTIVSVEGFTRSEARKFASRIVLDKSKVEQILDFNPAGGKQEVSLCKCPILLSFICILVRETALDLSDETIATGEMYTRMIKRLYTKFTLRRGIKYDEMEFTKVVGLVGKLAWETLLSNNPLFERSRVEKEVGEDVFDYGFLIGNEDLMGDVKADILITFPHNSIQQYFGAFFFILQLIEGKKIADLLEDSRDKHEHVQNPLFLHFCFWFLSDNDNFVLGAKDTARKNMQSFLAM